MKKHLKKLKFSFEKYFFGFNKFKSNDKFFDCFNIQIIEDSRAYPKDGFHFKFVVKGNSFSFIENEETTDSFKSITLQLTDKISDDEIVEIIVDPKTFKIIS
jgi:hypothetical protein